MALKGLAKKTTIHEVAELAGVSIKTVSRVVNKEEGLRDETRAKVLKAITKLNYSPNFSARGLAGSHSFLIGLLYDNPSANYIIDIQNGLLGHCRKEGFDLLIHPCDSSSASIQEEVNAIIEKTRLGGLVLTPPLSDNSSLLAYLKKRQFPVAVIAPGGNDHGFPSISSDDRKATFALTEHLLELGHRKIAFIAGHPSHGMSEQRLLGFRDAMLKHRVKVSERLIVQGYFEFDSGREAMGRLLKLKNRPTAVLASNDDMAAGAIFEARSKGVEIPNEISIAGFDDTPLASQVWPALTTATQPIQDMGAFAGKALIQMIRRPQQALEQITLPCKLQIRNSTQRVQVLTSKTND